MCKYELVPRFYSQSHRRGEEWKAAAGLALAWGASLGGAHAAALNGSRGARGAGEGSACNLAKQNSLGGHQIQLLASPLLPHINILRVMEWESRSWEKCKTYKRRTVEINRVVSSFDRSFGEERNLQSEKVLMTSAAHRINTPSPTDSKGWGYL